MASRRFVNLFCIKHTRTFATSKNFLNEVKYISRPNGNKIAYRQNMSDNLDAIGVVFCSGFQSNMQGVKAVAIENYCKNSNLPFVR